MTYASFTSTSEHARPNLSRQATTGLLRTWWRTYWEWRGREATIRILHSLDQRTLKDIGITPHEIESLVHGRLGDRLRCYDVNWRSHFATGGAECRPARNRVR